jgi:aldehyde dehydrogenase (NAD+)
MKPELRRLRIAKTPKVYLGGAFVRSESGRVQPLLDAEGRFVVHIPQCTRKDLRNAVEGAAKAGPGWARRTPFNRGQILYRLAEMLEGRAGELAESLRAGSVAPPGSRGARTMPSRSAARREVAAACDRLVHFAGWADKFAQVLGNTNPVASPHFSFTVCEPMGVVGVIAGEEAPLLGLLSQLAPIIVSGNTVVALASETRPMPALLLGEILAVSDLPPGVVNLLTGRRTELATTFATHAHVRALDVVVADPRERQALVAGAAASVKRVLWRDPAQLDWSDDEACEGVYPVRNFIEFKTTWHPIGA